MSTPVGLLPGIQVVAFKLQEGMLQGDVRRRLDDAINDYAREQGTWGYYIDHDGDGDSGDVYYSCQGDTRKASYEMATVGGKAAINIDFENSANVVPVTSYQEEAEDDDHYAAMEESYKSQNLYSSLPLYERFISKGERDAAGDDDFAGKGKSFPILKPADVKAAVHAMGRAGTGNYGMSTLKANIIRIAKKKGWTKYLPKTWRGDSSSSTESGRTPQCSLDMKTLHALQESGILTADQVQAAVSASASGKLGADVNRGTVGALALVESASTLETIVLKEAKSDYEIKLIAPGPGSSAVYPAEVLKRDGPNVFRAGTHVYLNHPTEVEEAQRPEGDVKNLAGVLTTSAVYHEAHSKGPGLYARMKVFADHAQIVEEKAAHVGMSIRASGIAESGKKQNGLPILKELTSAESVDVVTRAGAGGMILTEAARTANNQQEGEVEMTLQEAQKLVADEVAKATAPLIERGLVLDAREEAGRILEASALPPVAKARVTEAAVARKTLKDGKLDLDAFRAVVVEEAKREGQYLASILPDGQVRGMGASFGVEPIDDKKLRKEAKRRREEEQNFDMEESEVFADLTGLPVRKVEAA